MRCFVAAELPEPVRDALARWTPRDDALRPVRAASLHVTLAFLGERSADVSARVGTLLAGLARPVPALALGAPRWLPARRARALAVDVHDGDGALGALQADVVAALAREVGFVVERRRFLAHVTVARVRRGAPAPRIALGDAAGAGTFAAVALTLLRSTPAPGGSRYEPLAREPLDAGDPASRHG